MNGFIKINKPKGITSHFAVRKVKKLLPRGTKVGHAGTLDPMAEGVLVVAIGGATKALSYIQKTDKRYSCTVQLGLETDTYDITGKEISRQVVNVTEDQIRSAVNKFVGDQMQIPPLYSAIKVNGKKAYEIARSGGTVELKKRNITIAKIEIISIDLKLNQIFLDVFCSTGTYIRSLAYDIGKELGCGATLATITRTAIGDIAIEDCLLLKEDTTLDEIMNNLEKPQKSLSGFGTIIIDDGEYDKVKNGAVVCMENLKVISEPQGEERKYMILDSQDNALALAMPDSYNGSEGFRSFKFIGQA